MTVVAEPVFIDTNILVYASVDSSPFYAAAHSALAQLATEQAPIWISRQVLREYLATIIRPQFGIPIAVIADAIRYFEVQYHIAEDSPLVTSALLTLLEQGVSRQVHDTNIVATMITYGIRRILTNNPADFAPYATAITIIPLA